MPREKLLHSKRDMENQIAVLLAGRAAELIVGGDDALTSGASGDLARAAEIAGSMIMELGMGDDPAVSERALGAACGSARSAEEQCRSKLNEMYAKVWDVLTAELDLLMDVTQALLEKEALDESDMETIFSRKKGCFDKQSH